MSKIDKLEKLARLKEKGILTKKEFEIEKKAILVKYEDDEEEDCGVDGNSHQNSAWGYFLDSFKKGPSGRATRSEFWSFVLFSVIFCVAISVGTFFLLDAGLVGIDFVVALSIGAIYPIVVGIFASIRRLHDIGCSGWYWGVSFIIGFCGGFIEGFYFGDPSISEVVTAINIVNLCYSGYLLYLYCLPSQSHDNKYGPYEIKEIS